MAARFTVSGDPHRIYGFDRFANPPWLMVGAGKVKNVDLRGGHGLTVRSTNKSTAVVFDKDGQSKASRQITIIGGSKGTAFIEARSGAIVRAKLEVSVKDLRTVKTAFHFVRDTATPRPNRTRRLHADVKPMLRTVNEIYLPQTNIFFFKHLVRDITVPGDFGRIVIDRPGHVGDEWEQIVIRGDPTADFNVFFVWEVEQFGNVGDEQALSEHIDDKGNCIFEDNAGPTQGVVLAHEAGHFLGIAHPPGPRYWLMYREDLGGRHIPKEQANIMNP